MYVPDRIICDLVIQKMFIYLVKAVKDKEIALSDELASFNKETAEVSTMWNVRKASTALVLNVGRTRKETDQY